MDRKLFFHTTVEKLAKKGVLFWKRKSLNEWPRSQNCTFSLNRRVIHDLIFTLHPRRTFTMKNSDTSYALDRLMFSRAFSVNGEKQEFMDWCRISSAMFYGMGVTHVPLFTLHAMAQLCLWFICNLAKECKREAFISLRAKVNVFDTMKAMMRISPRLAQQILKGDTKVVFPHPFSLTPTCYLRPNDSFPLSRLFSSDHLLNHTLSFLKRPLVSKVHLYPDIFQELPKQSPKQHEDDEEEEEEEEEDDEPQGDRLSKTVPTLEESRTLRDTLLESHDSTLHFPPLPHPALTHKSFIPLSLVSHSSSSFQPPASTHDTRKWADPSSLAIRQLEDKLHVQLLLPKVCDMETVDVCSANVLYQPQTNDQQSKEETSKPYASP